MRLPTRLPRAARPVLRQPWLVLVPLIVGQWTAVAVFARVVRHNGWLFYQGGDETFYYTSAWVIAHGHIPEAAVGYGWSYLISPIAALAGANYLAGLPALVLFQVVVLLPIALACVYGITARIGGRVLGYVAAALWVALPFLLIPLWDQRYHEKYVEQFLPQALGLTGLADFPSMVCLLVAGLFGLRALDTEAPLDAAVAGLAAGLAIGIKPANTLFLAGPLLAFPYGRRFREAFVFGAALLPSLVALALWKYRGLGHLPIISSTPNALAAGAAGFPVASGRLSEYLTLDWGRLRENYLQLREFLPSLPLLQALPLAGVIGAALRSRPKTLLLVGWLGAFILVKGTSDEANIEGGTLLRLLIPCLPLLVVFVALVPLLLPLFGLRGPQLPPPPARPARSSILAGAALAFAIVPVLLFLALDPLKSTRAVKYFPENVMVPVDGSLEVDVRRRGRRAAVSWRPPSSAGVGVFYRVYRSAPAVPAPDPTLPPGRNGIRCLRRTTSAADCRLEMRLVAVTRSRSFIDKSPPRSSVYRVGLSANWRDDPNSGDVLLLSRAARR
jgi:hypothetical protein